MRILRYNNNRTKDTQHTELNMRTKHCLIVYTPSNLYRLNGLCAWRTVGWSRIVFSFSFSFSSLLSSLNSFFFFFCWFSVFFRFVCGFLGYSLFSRSFSFSFDLIFESDEMDNHVAENSNNNTPGLVFNVSFTSWAFFFFVVVASISSSSQFQYRVSFWYLWFKPLPICEHIFV